MLFWRFRAHRLLAMGGCCYGDRPSCWSKGVERIPLRYSGLCRRNRAAAYHDMSMGFMTLRCPGGASGRAGAGLRPRSHSRSGARLGAILAGLQQGGESAVRVVVLWSWTLPCTASPESFARRTRKWAGTAHSSLAASPAARCRSLYRCDDDTPPRCQLCAAALFCSWMRSTSSSSARISASSQPGRCSRRVRITHCWPRSTNCSRSSSGSMAMALA